MNLTEFIINIIARMSSKASCPGSKAIILPAVFVVFMLITALPAQTQELSLQQCYEKAIQNHPVGLQKEKLEQVNQLNKGIESTAWLPQLSFNAQASYQSDVTGIDIPIPGVEVAGPTKDQYRMTLEAQQLIYDGGMNRRRNNLRESAHAAQLQEVEVKLYALLEQVNRHFFQHFILSENIKVIEMNLEEIGQRLELIESAILNGSVLPSSKWVLQAEMIRLRQGQEELLSSLQTNKKILEILLGEEFEDDALVLPRHAEPSLDKINRPELQLYSLQKEQLFSAEQLTAVTTRPRISSFIQAGYGKPGLNMLSNEFDPYYIAGIRLNWTIWDWNKTRRERQVHQVRASIIDVQEQVFTQNLQVALTSVQGKIDQLEKAMENDLQIIELYTMVIKSSESQLQNGVINSTEYLHQLNTLAKARADHQTNRIKWLQAVAEYNIITGNIQ